MGIIPSDQLSVKLEAITEVQESSTSSISGTVGRGFGVRVLGFFRVAVRVVSRRFVETHFIVNTYFKSSKPVLKTNYCFDCQKTPSLSIRSVTPESVFP